MAPAASSLALAAAASSLLTFSLIGLGAASTRSLDSFRPKVGQLSDGFNDVNLVSADFFEDDSKFSFFLNRSGSGAAAPAAGAAATATGAAALIPNFFSRALTRSANSRYG